MNLPQPEKAPSLAQHFRALQNEELARGETELRSKSAPFTQLLDLDNLTGMLQKFDLSPDLLFLETLRAHPALASAEEISDFEFLHLEFREAQTPQSAQKILEAVLTQTYRELEAAIPPNAQYATSQTIAIMPLEKNPCPFSAAFCAGENNAPHVSSQPEAVRLDALHPQNPGLP